MFPAYRKYKNSNTFFKLITENSFEEITFIGTKGYKYDIEAKQYPEFLRIQDMLNCKDGAWVEISEGEYTAQKNSI
jgi:hypothetical protein